MIVQPAFVSYLTTGRPVFGFWTGCSFDTVVSPTLSGFDDRKATQKNPKRLPDTHGPLQRQMFFDTVTAA